MQQKKKKQKRQKKHKAEEKEEEEERKEKEKEEEEECFQISYRVYNVMTHRCYVRNLAKNLLTKQQKPQIHTFVSLSSTLLGNLYSFTISTYIKTISQVTSTQW